MLEGILTFNYEPVLRKRSPVGLSIDLVETEQDRDAIHVVRNRVFVQEQHVPLDIETDDVDSSAYHAIARWEGKIVGTGRLVVELPHSGKIGRMAVLTAYRKLGVGGQILSFLEIYAENMGIHEITLHAQVYVKDFYQKKRYQEEGLVFLEAGIEHILMRKNLNEIQK